MEQKHEVIPATKEVRSYWEPTDEDLRTIREHICRDLDEHEFKLFLYVAKARGLNPLLKQIYAVKYPGYGDRQAQVSHITSLDGYLLIAERTGQYEGHELEVFDGKSAPIAVCTVFRRGKRPCKVVCDYWEFCQVRRGRDGKEIPVKNWQKMPKWMIGKVSLARALARAFPEELGGIYTSDEMPSAPEPSGNGNSENEASPSASEAREALVSEAKARAGVSGSVQPSLAPEDFTSVPSQTTNGVDGQWIAMAPQDKQLPVYRAWYTELSKGNRAGKMIGEQGINYLRGYLNKHVQEISQDEVTAVNTALAEMGRQWAAQCGAHGPKLKVPPASSNTEPDTQLPSLPTQFDQQLYEELGAISIAAGKHQGRQFWELDTSYLNGHYELNRGNFDPRYEHSLLRYVTLRKLKEQEQGQEQRLPETTSLATDNIPAEYLAEAKANEAV